MRKIIWLALAVSCPFSSYAWSQTDNPDAAALGSAFSQANSDHTGTSCVTGKPDKPQDTYTADLVYITSSESTAHTTMKALDAGLGYSSEFIDLQTSYESSASEFLTESKSSTYILARGLASRTYTMGGKVSAAVPTTPAYDFYTKCGTNYIRSLVRQRWFYAIVDISSFSSSDLKTVSSSFKNSGHGYGVNEHLNTGDVDQLQRFLTKYNLNFHFNTSDPVKPFGENPTVKQVWDAAQAAVGTKFDEGNSTIVSLGLGSYKDINVDQPPEIEGAAGAISAAVKDIADFKASRAKIKNYQDKTGEFVTPTDPVKLEKQIEEGQQALTSAIEARYDLIDDCRAFLSQTPNGTRAYKRLRNSCVAQQPKGHNIVLAFLPSSHECSPSEAAPSNSVGGGGCIRAERNDQGTCMCTECGFVRDEFAMEANEHIGLNDDKAVAAQSPLDPLKGQSFECRGMNPGASAVIEDHMILYPPTSPAEIGYRVTIPPSTVADGMFAQGNISHMRVERSASAKIHDDGSLSTRLYMEYCWTSQVRDTCKVTPDESGYAITIRQVDK